MNKLLFFILAILPISSYSFWVSCENYLAKGLAGRIGSYCTVMINKPNDSPETSVSIIRSNNKSEIDNIISNAESMLVIGKTYFFCDFTEVLIHNISNTCWFPVFNIRGLERTSESLVVTAKLPTEDSCFKDIIFKLGFHCSVMRHGDKRMTSKNYSLSMSIYDENESLISYSAGVIHKMDGFKVLEDVGGWVGMDLFDQIIEYVQKNSLFLQKAYQITGLNVPAFGG
ncbi:hypothetical protein CI610_01682 [invertebrate metagenome]|uniref:Uncharacterized protein n=1 Tax=invertebrate metagenome TaxID=1711999 RepID=A0A2H9T7X1_9ZZZZ